MTEPIQIPKEVIDKNGKRAIVVSVHIAPLGDNEATHDIKLDQFLESYTEYIDPKDLEIARLKEALAKEKAKNKPERKPRRVLTKGELAEVEELLRRGEGNTELGNQYGCSDSAISRIRVRMREAGEDV